MPSKSLPMATTSMPPTRFSCRAMATRSSTRLSRPAAAGVRNSGQKFSPITPPRSARARIISSVRFRGWGLRARQLEWVATKGRLARATTSRKPPSDRWLTSTSIPSSCMRTTASLPKGVKPADMTAGSWELGAPKQLA